MSAERLSLPDKEEKRKVCVLFFVRELGYVALNFAMQVEEAMKDGRVGGGLQHFAQAGFQQIIGIFAIQNG